MGSQPLTAVKLPALSTADVSVSSITIHGK